jgi:hypothetical protein
MNSRIGVLLLLLLVGSMFFTSNCGDKEQVREDIVRIALEIEALKPAYRQRIMLQHPRKDEKVSYTMDCSGFVFAVYNTAVTGIFEKQKNKIKGANGVRIIYNRLKKLQRIYRKKIPQVADIVFFDNTYDRNANGVVDDELVHVGIVLAVNEMGTITFIHSSTSAGVTRGYANLSCPNEEKLNGEPLNSSLRRQRASDPPDTRYCAGALIHAFGAVFDVPEDGEDF